ncbi:DnaJ family domain-containing protein [Pseudogulbenkiania sp. MAI-1]|uniref:DnaJ family domain-containing protein n=1 Tax=Pseudogulbenkiania sp. MAI-1 TaxID=990370 RepID=UPI00045EA185|nr:DnaJ family domain-containing protein [Pseudogulbenkiania sp. MAI-1]
MDILALIGEKRLAEAAEKGELSNLPGEGQPLPEDDISPLVPPEQRMAWRILKNAGYLPPELEARREAVQLAMTLADAEGEALSRGLKRLALLNQRLTEVGLPPVSAEGAYGAKLLRRLER